MRYSTQTYIYCDLTDHLGGLPRNTMSKYKSTNGNWVSVASGTFRTQRVHPGGNESGGLHWNDELRLVRLRKVLNDKIKTYAVGRGVSRTNYSSAVESYREIGEGDSAGCLHPEPRGLHAWPTLLIESGLSRSMMDLRRDMRWWFSRFPHQLIRSRLSFSQGMKVLETRSFRRSGRRRYKQLPAH
ncbi:hypothetical protein N656DRAFT_408924 [Canariomyces notabilis]|uniref:Uncharacterized protein n=1 Tax=Canariomyces notabilis TaxID=2074819 RepID=A0AAN6YWX3_9PEZI|nr:hypothetical protein N656DRAFT_408924 [Canariomyces arenarius]